MVTRRGSATTGCLVWLLIVVVIIYVGINVGEPYFRYYRYRDAISQQVRFAGNRADSTIVREIHAAADSLDLPPEAYDVSLDRTPNGVRVTGGYDDAWSIGKYTRPVHFDIFVSEAP